MHPILFEFGPIKIFTYGFFLAVAFLTAIFVAGREAQRLGIPKGQFYDLCFYIIVAALVGSRLLYVLLEMRTFLAHPLKIFALWEGGLVCYGGVILALLVAFFYMRIHGLPWRATLTPWAWACPWGNFSGASAVLWPGAAGVLLPTCPGRWSLATPIASVPCGSPCTRPSFTKLCWPWASSGFCIGSEPASASTAS